MRCGVLDAHNVVALVTEFDSAHLSQRVVLTVVVFVVAHTGRNAWTSKVLERQCVNSAAPTICQSAEKLRRTVLDGLIL